VSGLPSPDERRLNYGNAFQAARIDEQAEAVAPRSAAPPQALDLGGPALPPTLSKASGGLDGEPGLEEGGGDDVETSLDTGSGVGQAGTPDDLPTDPKDLANQLSEVSADPVAVHDLLWAGVQSGLVRPGEIDDVLALLRGGGQGGPSEGGEDAPRGTLPDFLRAAGIRAAAIGQTVVGDPAALHDPAVLAHEMAHVAQHRAGGGQIHYDAGTKEDSTEEKQAREAETDLTNVYADTGTKWGTVAMTQHGDKLVGTYFYFREINHRKRAIRGRLYDLKKDGKGWKGRYVEWWPKGRGKQTYSDAVTITPENNDRDLKVAWGDNTTLLKGGPWEAGSEGARKAGLGWELMELGFALQHYDRKHPFARLGKALLEVDPGLVSEAIVAGADQRSPVRAATMVWNQLCVLGMYRQEEATVRFWVAEAGYGAGVAAKVMERARANPEAHTWLRTYLAGRWSPHLKCGTMKIISRGVLEGKDTASHFAGRKQAFSRNLKWLPTPNLEPGNVKNLDDAVRLAETWEVGLRSYIEADQAYCESVVKVAASVEALYAKKIQHLQSGWTWGYWAGFIFKQQGNAIASLKHDIARQKEFAKNARERLGKIKAGDTGAHRMLGQVMAVKEQAEKGRLELRGLQEMAANPDEKRVKAVVGKARLTIADCVKKLTAMQTDVAGMVKEADTLRQAARNNSAVARNNWRQAAKASSPGWVSRLWKAANGAMKGFAERLKTVDWREVLEVGLEIAGAVLTGGAAVVVKLLVWIAKTGQRLLNIKNMIDPVKDIIEGIRNLGGSVLDGLFSPAGLMATLGDVLFGKNAFAGVKLDTKVAKKAKGLSGQKPKRGKSKGLGRFLGIAGRVFGTLYGSVIKGVGWVAEGAKKLDMSQSPFFRKLAGIAAWLVNAGDRIQNVILLVRGQLGLALAKVREFVGKAFQQARKFIKGAMDAAKGVLAVLASPAKFLAGLIRKLVEWLIGTLVTSPPSKVVSLALKAAGVTASMAGAKLLGVADAVTAKTPIGPISKKIESLVQGSTLFEGVSAAVAPAFGMLNNLGGEAMQGIDATEASTKGMLGDGKKFAESVGAGTGSGGSGSDKAKPRAQGGQSPPSGSGKKSSAGSSGGGGGDDFVHHLKKNLLEFSDESTNFDPLVADIGKTVPKKAQEDAAKGFGLDSLLAGILSRPDWTDFLQPLGEVAGAAIPAWQHTVDRFTAIGGKPLAEMRKLAKAPVKLSDIKRTTRGKRVSLTMSTDQWLLVQRLFAMSAVFRYLLRVDDFGVGKKDKKGKKKKVGGQKGLELWLGQSAGQQAIKHAWSTVQAGLRGGSLFGTHPKGSPVGFSVRNGKVSITYAAAGDELPIKPSELPTFETDPDGSERKRIERTLTKMIWTGNWRRVVRFLEECGGWEGIGKQVGPRFAPQLLHFRNWICFELEKRYGAMRTGTASGFTSDEDLNFQWKAEDNKLGETPPNGPAERITQAERWMVKEFGDQWGMAFDIAFQLEARMAHLYTELADPKKRRELASFANVTSEAVNMERLAKGHHEDHEVTEDEMADVAERLGMPKSAGRALFDRLRKLPIFKSSQPDLRKRYDRLVSEWMRRFETPDDPNKPDDSRKSIPVDPEFSKLDKAELVKQIAYTQLALARLNPEAYASPGGVKTTVTGAILKGKVDKGVELTDKEKGQLKRTKEFSIEEALSSALEDNKNFEHQLSMGRFEDYPKLRLLVGDRDAWTEKEGGTKGKTKAPKGASAATRGRLAPSRADEVAAGFRYNLYKYAWRLFNMLVQINDGAVSIVDKQGTEHTLSISGIPQGVMNKWLMTTYSAYKIADNRTIYEHVVRKSLGSKATDPKVPLGDDVIANIEADVGYLNQTLDAVVNTLYKARGQRSATAAWKGTVADPKTFHTYFGGLKPPHLIEKNRKERHALQQQHKKEFDKTTKGK